MRNCPTCASVVVAICTLYFSGGCGSQIVVNPPAKPLPVVKTELRLASLPAEGSVIAQFPTMEQIYWEVSVPDADLQDVALQADFVSSAFERGEQHTAMERLPNTTTFRCRVMPLSGTADVQVTIALIHVPDAKQRNLGRFMIKRPNNRDE